MKTSAAISSLIFSVFPGGGTGGSPGGSVAQPGLLSRIPEIRIKSIIKQERTGNVMFLRKIILAIITGLLLSLSFPKADLFFVAWIALVPLFIALQDTTPKAALGYGFISGMVFFLLNLYWVKLFGILPWFLLPFFQALYFGFFALIIRIVHHHTEDSKIGILFPPLIWTVLEWLRSLGPLGFTWGGLGYSQYRFLPLIQIASVTGVYGITFIIVLTNTLIASCFQKKESLTLFRPKSKFSPKYLLMLAVLSIGLPAFAGWLSLIQEKPAAKSVTVAVIQPGIEQSIKWDKGFFDESLSILHRLILKAAFQKPEFIFIPETAITEYLQNNPRLWKKVSSWAEEAGAFLAVGALDSSPKAPLNTVFVFNPQGNFVDKYAKVKLVPFGEYLPWPVEKTIGHWKVFDPVQHFSPGKKQVVFVTPIARFGVLICFESLFPAMSRKLINNRVDFIAILTNDAWFKTTSAPYEHAYIAVFRAVENRVWIVQSANTGISCIIDSHGRIQEKSRLMEDKILVREVAIRGENSFYAHFGDVFVYLCIASSFLLYLVLKKRGKKLY